MSTIMKKPLIEIIMDNLDEEEITHIEDYVRDLPPTLIMD